jgi:hypothetical protein
VFLLALSGTPERAAALDRVAATLIGGALVFVVYLLRPTWSREHVAADLAEILEARRRYAVLVLRTHAGAGAGEAELRAAQAAARLARSNAEASVDQLAGEPVRPGAITVRSAVGILAASERLSIAALALHARLGRVPVVALPAFADLIDRLDGALDALVDALRAAAAPPALPPLRELQVQVQHELERAGAEGDAIVSATDLMVDGVNTIADILRRLPRKEPDVRT